MAGNGLDSVRAFAGCGSMIRGRRVRPWDNKGLEGDDPEPPDGVYGHWYDDKQGAWVLPEYVTYSDYSGSLVERSNLEVFIEEFADSEDEEWVQIHGGHGTRGLIVRVDADERVPEIGEFFERLDQYPLADEDHHSHLEQEVIDEAWASYGRGDFRRWLKADSFHETVSEDWDEAVDGLVDEQIDNIWWAAVSEGSGEEARVEDAVNVYFDFDRAFENRDLEGEILRVSGRVNWGRALREYLQGSFRNGRSEFIAVLKEISDETLVAFLDYLAGRRASALDPTDPTTSIETVLQPLSEWSNTRWSVLFDAMLEEGPDAFKHGGHGRTLGRR